MTNDMKYAVTGDFSRLVYSRHSSLGAAQKARQKLARKWGYSHPGSEPRVVLIPEGSSTATHIVD